MLNVSYFEAQLILCGLIYFQQDVMNWIRENKEKYNIHHLMTLVSFGAHNKLPQASKNKISELRETIREM